MTQDSSVSPEPVVSEAQLEAVSLAAKEKRPVEFVTPLKMVPITMRTQKVSERAYGMLLMWAWPDGTITRPESLRQRMRNLLHGRVKHGEVHPTTAYEIAHRARAKHGEVMT